MKVYTCILLFIKIIACLSVIQNRTTKDRSVNLALETVLEFDNKDHSGDVKFLDNVQNFITKVKTVIGKNKNARRTFTTSKVKTLTDFIVEVINIVNTFEDRAFQDFYEILDEEIRKYHYRGCKFYELTESFEIRKFLADKLNLIRGKPIVVIKSYVNSLTDIIRSQSYDKLIKDLVDYINSLYRQDAREKFTEILGDLEFYSTMKSKRSNTNLVKIVRAGIRTNIFDHYTNLNPNARRELKSKIESFWKQFYRNSSTSSKSDNFIKVNNDNYGEYDKSEISTHESAEHKNKNNTTNSQKIEKHTAEQKEKRIDIKKSDYKKKGIMRDGVKQKKVEKVPKYTKIDTGYEDDGILKVTTRKTPHGESRPYDSKHLSERSSTEDVGIDSTSETLEKNSIEQYQKRQEEINTQRYVTLYPEPITYNEEVTEEQKSDKENVVHRSARMSPLKPVVQTMWIEESTGRIPKSAIEQYNQMMKKQHVKQKPKYHSREKNKKWSKKASKHKSKHGTRYNIKRQGHKHEVKQKRKHKSKHKSNRHSKHKPVISKLMPKHKKAKLFSENHAFVDIVGTKMEYYEYKKMMDPAQFGREREEVSNTPKSSTPMKSAISIRVPVSFTKRSTTPSRLVKVITHPSIPPRSSTPSRLIISNHSLAKSPTKWLVTAPLEMYSRRYELLTGKQHREFRKRYPISTHDNSTQDKKHKSRRKTLGNITDKFDMTADISVLKRINELEKELKEVKNKMDVIKTEDMKLKQIADKLLVNEGMEKNKKGEINARKDIKAQRKDLNLKKENKAIEYKTEFKFALENNNSFHEFILKSPVTKTNVTDIKITRLTPWLETTKKSDVLTKIFKDAQAEKKVKLMIGDHKVKAGPEHVQDNIQAKGFVDEDQYDIWKDSFKYYTKPSTRVTTTKPTKSTTRSENTTTIKSTKMETISSKVELFISVPSMAPSTNKPLINRKDTKLSLPTVDAENTTKTTKNQSINEPIKNVTKEVLIKDVIQKNNTTNMVTSSVLTKTTDTRILITDKIKRRRELLYSSPPLWSIDNNNTNGLFMNDVFDGNVDELSILRK